MNYKWGLTGAGILGLNNGMKPIATNITADSLIATHQDTVTSTRAVEDEYGGLKDVTTTRTTAFSPGIDFNPVKDTPPVSNGVITAHLGDVTCHNPPNLELGVESVCFYAYGHSSI